MTNTELTKIREDRKLSKKEFAALIGVTPMLLTWIGHSCFKIESNGFTLILDPYEDGYVPGLKPLRETADMVLCSHDHGDHNAKDLVEIKEGKNCPFTITTIDTFHDEVQGAKRGPDKIHIIDDGNVRIAHLGDLGCELEDEQIQQLKDLAATGTSVSPA